MNKQDSYVIAILGSGVQARAHIAVMVEVCGAKLKEIRIWGRTKSKVEALINEQRKIYPKESFPFEFVCSSSPKECSEGADIINTTTSSSTVVLEGAWLKKGAHVNAVGACQPHTREVDADCIVRSSVYLDSKESAWKEAGELLIPQKEGIDVKSKVVGEIGQLLLGEIPGRKDANQITFFKSLGIAIEDIVVGYHVWKLATQKKVGTKVFL
eukprot:TRINITY_DN1100_c0_g1_i3.p1 TRINITY_DN1100_c0_g1~~TRINITY_DN1100_c0_g1_i3.p1  ORF type:complete len:212 (-),score=46.69 TRINITY_DN1100_c0_g1_i3:81-716(-)